LGVRVRVRVKVRVKGSETYPHEIKSESDKIYN